MVNGCPKSGTHALMAWLSRMGLQRVPGTLMACSWNQPLHIAWGPVGFTIEAAREIPDSVFLHGHVNARHPLEGFRVVTVLRDPRNVLVSYCRHRKTLEGLDVSIPQALADFWGAPFVPTYAGFLGWRGRSIIVRYEDMPPSVTGDGARLYDHSDRDYNTRTGSPSQWREVWTEAAETAWVEHGGYELLAEAGYG